MKSPKLAKTVTNRAVQSQEFPLLLESPCQSYAKERKKSWEAWGSLRENLLKARTEEFCLATFKCVKCDTVEREIIRCTDCSTVAYYCHTCCDDVHATFFYHNPGVWKGTVFIPWISQRKAVLWRSEHDCSSAYRKEICIVDSKGFQDRQTVGLCRCEKEPVTLIRYGLWPTTAEYPWVAVSIDLMEMAMCLQLEGQVSLHTFCDALSCIRNYRISDHEEVKDVYRLVIGDCTNEYRYHSTKLNQCAHLYKPEFGCPACNRDSAHNQTLSVDANFGLMHKKSSGPGHGFRHHSDDFFL